MLVLPATRLNSRQFDRMISLLFPPVAELTLRPELRQIREQALPDAFAALPTEFAMPVAAALFECLPGGIVNLIGPAAQPGHATTEVFELLLREGEQHARRRQMVFLQSLRPADEDASILEALGVRRVTSMQSMRRSLAVNEPSQIGKPRLKFEDQATGVSQPFQETMMASFEGSLDCPEWNGYRSAERVIAGHRNAAPDTSQWWLASLRGRPAGVLILAADSTPGQFEIAYMGVDPSVRGRGLGGVILDFAIHHLLGQAARVATLLVDDRNRPAFELYRSRGFQVVETRALYLRNLQLL